MTLGLDEDDEKEVVDRSYWEKRGTKATVALADRLLKYIHSFAPAVDLKYNKFYVGLAREGQTNNFAIFKPQKNAIRLEVRTKKSDEIESQISENGLDLMDYSKWGRYRIRLSKSDIHEHEDFITQLLKLAYDETTG
jgi:predicted transport protein